MTFETDVIAKSNQVPVVVLPKDHELTLLDSVAVADLVEEHLLQDPDTLPEWRDAAALLRSHLRLQGRQLPRGLEIHHLVDQVGPLNAAGQSGER